MGGYGSGRHGGRPTADSSLRVDLAWMIRNGRATPGCLVSGSLNWTRGGEPSGSIGYEADMVDINQAKLVLKYRRGSGEKAESVRQDVSLTYTEPNYGGRRWWMICPVNGRRVGMLYLPVGGDRFASRHVWRLGYQSQRISDRQRPFEAMFRLQKRLGGSQGWDMGLAPRPKGMWHRTYKRQWAEYDRLDQVCSVEMDRLTTLLSEYG